MRTIRRVEIAAWTAGLLLLMLYGGLRASSEQSRRQGVAAVQQARDEFLELQQAPMSERRFAAAAPDTSTWSQTRLAAYRESLRQVTTPEAVLRIPAVALSVPVFEGTGESNLNRGAGRIEGTARIGEHGNVGLAAHRDGFFRILKDVRVGDALYLDRGSGTLSYRIVSMRIVDPSDTDVLAGAGSPTVTLVTCYPFYFAGSAPKRFIVQAKPLAMDGGLAAH